jgi:hypothetical protein
VVVVDGLGVTVDRVRHGGLLAHIEVLDGEQRYERAGPSIYRKQSPGLLMLGSTCIVGADLLF